MTFPPKRPVPGNRVRHMDMREGVMTALDPQGKIFIATVAWDDGTTEPVSLGYLERIGLPSAHQTPLPPMTPPTPAEIRLGPSETEMLRRRFIEDDNGPSP